MTCAQPSCTRTTLQRRAPRVWLVATLLAIVMANALFLPAPRLALADELPSSSAPADDGASFSNAELRSNAADPCIIQVGSFYYLFSTTGNTKIPYYVSYDLKNWTYAGNALSSSAFTGTGLSRGDVWAPEVRERTVGGKTTYVLTYTAADYWDDQYRVCVAEASEISPGSFGRPKVLDTGSVANAIDSDILFDGDDIWLYFKNEDDYQSICVERLGANWSRKSDPKPVLRMDQDWESTTIEGPWAFRMGSTYYLMYSSGDYTTKAYGIGYAVSDSPAGPFTKMTTSEPLVRSQLGVKGPGHNAMLFVSEGEIYLVYHSLHTVGETDRMLMIDRMGVDADGRLFVNFSGYGQQPLPSGALGYYQISADDYSVSSSGVQYDALSDVISSQSDDTEVETISVSSLTIDVADGYHVSDIWLFGSSSGLKGTASLIINGAQLVEGYQLSDMATKLTLPGVDGYVRTIEVRLSPTQGLSEVLLVSQGRRWGVSVYRMYNTRSSEHLYTTDVSEYGKCGKGAYADWQAEGVAWQAPLPGDEGNVAVWRLYNVISGDHHYTTDDEEKASLLAIGDWVAEGVAFYSGGDVEIHRLYNGRLWRGQHHYTTSDDEASQLVARYGWSDEGIGFNALAI